MAMSISTGMKCYLLELNFDSGAAKVDSYNCSARFQGISILRSLTVLVLQNLFHGVEIGLWKGAN